MANTCSFALFVDFAPFLFCEGLSVRNTHGLLDRSIDRYCRGNDETGAIGLALERDRELRTNDDRAERDREERREMLVSGGGLAQVGATFGWEDELCGGCGWRKERWRR
jgi:hypothetical protein